MSVGCWNDFRVNQSAANNNTYDDISGIIGIMNECFGRVPSGGTKFFQIADSSMSPVRMGGATNSSATTGSATWSLLAAGAKHHSTS